MNNVKAEYKFSIGGKELAIGLYEDYEEQYPNILTPALLLKTDGNWSRVATYDTLWEDIQKEINPEIMATLILKRFNAEIKVLTDGVELTWGEKLIAIFTLRVALEGNELILKEAS